VTITTATTTPLLKQPERDGCTRIEPSRHGHCHATGSRTKGTLGVRCQHTHRTVTPRTLPRHWFKDQGDTRCEVSAHTTLTFIFFGSCECMVATFLLSLLSAFEHRSENKPLHVASAHTMQASPGWSHARKCSLLMKMWCAVIGSPHCAQMGEHFSQTGPSLTTRNESDVTGSTLHCRQTKHA
jgi:hypothetical protein